METPVKIIAIRKGYGFIFIKQSEIVHCDLVGRKTAIFMKDGRKYIVSSPISGFLNRLDKTQFVLVHNTNILNKDFVSEIVVNNEGAFAILNDNTKILFTKSKKLNLVKFISDFIIDGDIYTPKEKPAEEKNIV